jgi:signal transduction histidine kinase
MPSIKTKIIFAYTLVFGALLLVFAAIVYQSSKEAAFNKLDANLKSYSISLQTEIVEELNENNSFDMKELASIQPQGLSNAKYQLLSAEGRIILFDSLISKSFPINSAKGSGEISFYQDINLNSQSYKILVTPFETMEDSLYILETAASANEAYEDLNRLFYLFLLLVPMGLIIAGFAAYLISKAAFKPITRIVNTAKNISAKNLDKRLELPRAKDEVRELAEALNEMIERLDDSFKSQRIFVANASHEIKTPLTVIQIQLDSLKKNLNRNDDLETVEDSIAEIEKLTKLTNSLLILVKLDSAQYKLIYETVRLDELLADCVQMTGKYAQIKNLKINLSISDAIEVTADKEKLRSVFINLLDNAVKYSFKNTEINLNLHELENNNVKITIENCGTGIEPGEIEHIFKRFYRSNEIRADICGSGLGLAIAKEIVELHGGEIKVQSKPGRKTVFIVIIPIKNTTKIM